MAASSVLVAKSIVHRDGARSDEFTLPAPDDADAGPVQIHETGRRVEVLKRAPASWRLLPKALEQLVQERLRLGSLGARVCAPPLDEQAESLLDLLPAACHGSDQPERVAGKVGVLLQAFA